MGGRLWTQEELDTLESMAGTYTVATIAKRLGRSFDATNIKLNRKIGKVTVKYGGLEDD